MMKASKLIRVHVFYSFEFNWTFCNPISSLFMTKPFFFSYMFCCNKFFSLINRVWWSSFQLSLKSSIFFFFFYLLDVCSIVPLQYFVVSLNSEPFTAVSIRTSLWSVYDVVMMSVSFLFFFFFFFRLIPTWLVLQFFFCFCIRWESNSFISYTFNIFIHSCPLFLLNSNFFFSPHALFCSCSCWF